MNAFNFVSNLFSSWYGSDATVTATTNKNRKRSNVMKDNSDDHDDDDEPAPPPRKPQKSEKMSRNRQIVNSLVVFQTSPNTICVTWLGTVIFKEEKFPLTRARADELIDEIDDKHKRAELVHRRGMFERDANEAVAKYEVVKKFKLALENFVSDERPAKKSKKTDTASATISKDAAAATTTTTEEKPKEPEKEIVVPVAKTRRIPLKKTTKKAAAEIAAAAAAAEKDVAEKDVGTSKSTDDDNDATAAPPPPPPSKADENPAELKHKKHVTTEAAMAASMWTEY